MLTLKKFRELTENMPEDTILNSTVEFGDPNAIRGVINQVHIVRKKHSYSKENYIVLTQDIGDDLIVKEWIGKNTYKHV